MTAHTLSVITANCTAVQRRGSSSADWAGSRRNARGKKDDTAAHRLGPDHGADGMADGGMTGFVRWNGKRFECREPEPMNGTVHWRKTC